MSSPVQRLTALLLAAGLTTACLGPQYARRAEQQQSEGDVDGAVATLREAVERTPPGPQADLYQRRLNEAIQRALQVHLGAAAEALAHFALATAEREYALAAGYDPHHPEVAAGKARAAEVRTRGAQAIAKVRQLLDELATGEPKLEDRARWHQVIAELRWLHGWSKDFPEAKELRTRAQGPVRAFLLAEARQLRAVEELEAAGAVARMALEWEPNDAEAKAILDEISGLSDVEAQAKAAAQHLAEGRHEQAVAAYRAAFERNPQSYAARQGLAEAQRQWAQELLKEAREAWKAGRAGAAMQAIGKVRGLQVEDPALQAEIAKTARDVFAKARAVLLPRAVQAQGRGWHGAALLYLRTLQALLGEDKDVARLLAKVEPALQAQLAYRLELPPVTLAKGVPAGAATALQSALVRQLEAAGLAQRRVAAVTGKAARNSDGVLAVTLTELDIQRRQEQEARTKDFLDHVDIVDNPAWGEAQGRMATALTALNSASDALRPVVDEVNKAEASLHRLQEQLAEIRKKIKEEDAEHYAGKPSPCKDGGLACPETRGHQRWKQNVEFYETRIVKENDKLAKAGPELRRLQGKVDEAQRAFDEAQKVATETPRRIPREVWLPHAYEVTRHHLKWTAKLRVAWREGPGRGRAGWTERAAGEQALTDTRTDHSTGNVIVKGQVLEPLHESVLPDDASLTVDVAGRLVEGALAPVLDGLYRHAERFLRSAEVAKSDLERVHWLMLAALSKEALPAEQRAAAAGKVFEIAGWHPDTGAVDPDRMGLQPTKKP